MATLKAMFKLFDGYSSTIDKIDRKTTQATDKIIKASKGTDDFNKKLDNTGASANNASSGLGRLVKTVISLAAVKKGMDLTDTYINTNARLNLINDGLQTQSELQDKIFASADRAKGTYAEMADAVAKMGLLAGDAFSGNDELIGFTELVQKSFKLGGADTSEQQGAMRQLSQAMASGRLQGDEFVSISENAPLILEAISKYTGLSRGELKKLSSDGAITADIIKNSMFAMGDEIEDKFKEMPMTFGDIWSKIGNGATKAFRPVMESINNLINTDGFQNLVTGLIIAINILADDISWLFGLISENLNIILPILGAIGTVFLYNIITSLWAMIPPLLIQLQAWWAINAPIFLVALAIGLVIAILYEMGITFEDVFGFVGGLVGMFVAFFLNGFIMIWNGVAAFINFFGNVFTNPIASIKGLFYDLMVNVLGYIQTMAQGIEDLLNKIPGVKVSIAGGITGIRDKLAAKSSSLKSEADLKEFVKTKEFMDYSVAYDQGSGMGKKAANSIGDSISGLVNKFTGKNQAGDLGFAGIGSPGKGLGSAGKPLKVQGTGKNGKVDVSMDDADLKYLRDIAERDFINKFSTATLAPNIEITFGDVREEADANKLIGRIKTILQEEIATVAEGTY